MTDECSSRLAAGLEKIFLQRKTFIIIGLTGWTGSGCSSVADILQKKFPEISLPAPNCPFKNNDERKDSIIYEWAKKNWAPFSSINIGSIIFQHITLLDNKKLNILFKNHSIEKTPRIKKIISNVKEKLYLHYLIKNEMSEPDKNRLEKSKIDEIYKFYFEDLNNYSIQFKDEIYKINSGKYTDLMQEAGDNIRASGKANSNEVDVKNIFYLPEYINKIIKIGRKHCASNNKSQYFVIDSIRNPYEASFFKERYSSFYLLAITTDEETRIKRLIEKNYTKESIEKIRTKEGPKDHLDTYEHLISQNIVSCLEKSDVVIGNQTITHDTNHSYLKKSIIRYVSLMQHPGLVSPNSVERCMQIAVVAKLNSGCISRQVGATVTDKEFSIKAIGWNSVPKGQVPCSLRNVKMINDRRDCIAFSDFELQLKDEDFKSYFKNLKQLKCEGYSIEGIPLPYCFKTTYNKSKNDKNQVYTRSLHAEENAFLQMAKNGGSKLDGGFLFTTASPCELCSKKSYQLGITDIYYIDPYPGISKSQILECGNKDSRPKLHLFTGAIGRAYIQLYEPLIPMKDELKIILDKVE